MTEASGARPGDAKPARRYWDKFEDWWMHVRYLAWLLWVCRVPLMSALGGVILFVFAVPTQDMFLEIRNGTWLLPYPMNPEGRYFELYTGYLFWAVFHIILLYYWALVLYFWSAWIIDTIEADPVLQLSDAEPPRQAGFGAYWRLRLPLLLTFICFAAVLGGEWLALQNLHHVPTETVGSLSKYSEFHILLLVQCTLAAMVLTLVFRYRVRVLSKQEISGRLLVYVVVALALSGAVWWLGVWLAEGKTAETILKEALGLRSATARRLPIFLLVFAPTLMILGWVLMISLLFVLIYLVQGKAPGGNWNYLIVHLPLSAAFIAFVFLPSGWFPDYLYLERALLAPLVLSAWVPLLTYFSYWSHRFRAPVIILGLVALVIIGTVVGDGHDARRLANDGTWAAKRPTLDDAIAKWRIANGCRGASKCDRRPIVIAASGGASRAGFYTASVLGELTDKNSQFSKRLFAISSVSGSTLGAATYLSVLEDARQLGGRAPCSHASLVGRGKDPDGTKAKSLWFRAAIEARLLGKSKAEPHIPTWRECMQIMLSRDYLSPVFVSLVFKDLLWLQTFYGDRAEMLETSWNDHYLRALARELRPEMGVAATNRGRKSPGLERPFLSLVPTDDLWRPILIANGASGTTGRRVLTSTIKAEPKYFRDAYDVYELFEDDKESAWWSRWHDDTENPPGDLPLSGAVTMSARFPFVSPHGNVRNKNGLIVDRVVDGGYFESYGTLTASEVVGALRRAGLNPIALLVSNDPGLDQSLPCIGTRPLGAPDAVVSSNRTAGLAAISTPILGFLFSRPARGRLAAIRLCQQMAEGGQNSVTASTRPVLKDVGTVEDQENFALVRVFPAEEQKRTRVQVGVDRRRPDVSRCESRRPERTTKKQLSVSWWLSKPAQQYLDCQLQYRTNKFGISKVLKAIDE